MSLWAGIDYVIARRRERKAEESESMEESRGEQRRAGEHGGEQRRAEESRLSRSRERLLPVSCVTLVCVYGESRL